MEYGNAVERLTRDARRDHAVLGRLLRYASQRFVSTADLVGKGPRLPVTLTATVIDWLFNPRVKVPSNRVFEGHTFEDKIDRNSGRTIADLTLRRCQFIDCLLSVTTDPKRRVTVRDVQLIQCETRGSSIQGLVVEDVLVDGLQTHDLLQAWGPVFKHVTLRGRIGRMMISPIEHILEPDSSRQRAFDQANAAYYADVDWALDIREAEFVVADLRGVPGGLIRRDPSTQGLVTRAKADAGAWRALGPLPAGWDVAIERMLAYTLIEEFVLVACKRSRTFATQVDALRQLRALGVAEPD